MLTQNGLEVIDLDTGERTERNPALTWQPSVTIGRQLIHAGRLWDGNGDDYRRDVDLIVEGARIVSIQPHTPHPDDIPVIDAGARTVLPGLIDHHVHFEPHKGEWVGRSLLAFGITTAVEPGGLPYESREHMESWLSGRRAGPRLVFAGPQLDGARRTFHFASHIILKPGVFPISGMVSDMTEKDLDAETLVGLDAPVPGRDLQGRPAPDADDDPGDVFPTSYHHRPRCIAIVT